MSILLNSTLFNVSNTGSKYIQISLRADQDSSFRIRHSSKCIYETPRSNVEHASYASWFVHGITSIMRGSSMEYVRINLQSKETVQFECNCKSALIFDTRIVDSSSTDHNTGEMIIPPESQGSELHVIYSEDRGLGYTCDGNVAIGLKNVNTQTVIVYTIVKNVDGNALHIEDNTPAMCKTYI